MFDVIVVGTALETNGLSGKNTISGLGLVTYGFIWGCSEIWSPADESITTTWEVCNSSSGDNLETCQDD